MPRRHVASLSFASILALVVVAAVVAAGRHLPVVGAPRSHADAQAPAQADPPGWTRADTGRFSVALPPGWRYEPLQGCDSFVGLFVGDGVELQFDYGYFWLTLSEDPSVRDVTRTIVDFRAAEIQVSPDANGDIALYVEHVDDLDWGSEPTHLSIVGQAVPLERRDDVLAILRSLRFPRLLRDGGRWEIFPPPSGGVMLLDVGWLGTHDLWVVGARTRPEDAAGAVAFRRTGGGEGDGWEEHRLEDGGAIVAIAGPWALSWDALFHLDGDTGPWRRERTFGADEPMFDVAVTGSYREDGWAIGRDVVARLQDGRSTVADGGWGTAFGMAIDVLARGPLVPITRPQPAEAMAVHSEAAHTFDGQRWAPLAWDPGDFDPMDVDLVAPGEAWIVGAEPEHRRSFLHRTGDDWVAAPVTATNPLLGVDMLSGAEGWAVGGGSTPGAPAGELWRFRDGVWEALPVPCACVLRGVQALSDGGAYAVGWLIDAAPGADSAVVLRYVPGATPTPSPDPARSPTPTRTPAPTRTATATPAARALLPWAGRDGR